MTKIDRYVTVKRFCRTNDRGLHLFGVKQSKQIFFSEEANPVRAFERFCHKTSFMMLDGHLITREGRSLEEILMPAGAREWRYTYYFKVEGDKGSFATASDNIHRAFLQWKARQVLHQLSLTVHNAPDHGAAPPLPSGDATYE